MKLLKNFKIKYFVYLFLAIILILASIFIFSSNSETAFASEQSDYITYTQFYPYSSLEDHELSSPIDCAYWNYEGKSYFAVIEDSENRQNILTVAVDGEYYEYVIQITSTFEHIAPFYGTTIIASINGSCYTIDVGDKNSTPKILMWDGYNVKGNFDLNNNYLVTSSTGLTIYSLLNGRIIDSNIVSGITSENNTPVAINNNNEIFYISGGSIFKYSINTSSETEILPSKPDNMTANNTHLYFIKDSSIYTYSLENNTTQKLTITDNTDYDLGNVSYPRNLFFYNGNMLITDSKINAVQEFKIDNVNNTLDFTGFAIAKNKTAFNRVASNKIIKDIEKYGDKIAVLDDFKLTIIDTNNFVSTNKEAFTNLFIKEGLEQFSLGKTTVLTIKEQSVSLYDINKNEELFSTTIQSIKDCVYQSGKYYVLSYNGTISTVLEISEDGTKTNTTTYNEQYISICVDVFNEIKLYSENKKVLSDLTGKLFYLNGNSFAVENGNSKSVGFEIKSFTLDYITKEVFFTNKIGEIFWTKELSNTAISAIETPEGFLDPVDNANKEDLKILTVKDNSNIFNIDTNKKDYFSFVDLIEKEDEYCLLSNISLEDGNSIYALAGVNGVVLVNEQNCVEQTTIFSSSPEKVFTTTTVYIYSMPLITKDGEYRLYKDDYTKISKNDFVTTDGNSTLTFSGRDFYFVSYENGGVTKTGYIPVAFTVEVLFKDYEYTTFTYEKVDNTTLYLDNSMTSSIMEIEDGEKIKLFKTENDISMIAVFVDEGWIVGYIDSSAIKNEPNTTIRNILIIVGVLACVCGTATYFLLRKKD